MEGSAIHMFLCVPFLCIVIIIVMKRRPRSCRWWRDPQGHLSGSGASPLTGAGSYNLAGI